MADLLNTDTQDTADTQQNDVQNQNVTPSTQDAAPSQPDASNGDDKSQKLAQFYLYLKHNTDIKVPDSVVPFAQKMQDGNTANQFYNYVKSKGITVPDTYDKFADSMGFGGVQNNGGMRSIAATPNAPIMMHTRPMPQDLDKPANSNSNITQGLQDESNASALKQKNIESKNTAITGLATKRLAAQGKPNTPMNLTQAQQSVKDDLSSGILSTNINKDGTTDITHSASFVDGIGQATAQAVANAINFFPMSYHYLTNNTQGLINDYDNDTKQAQGIADNPWGFGTNSDLKYGEHLDYNNDAAGYGQMAGGIIPMIPLMMTGAGEAELGADAVHTLTPNMAKGLAGAGQAYLTTLPQRAAQLYNDKVQALVSQGVPESEAKQQVNPNGSLADAMIQTLPSAVVQGALFGAGSEVPKIAQTQDLINTISRITKNTAVFSALGGVQGAVDHIVKNLQGYHTGTLTDDMESGIKGMAVMTLGNEVLMNILPVYSQLSSPDKSVIAEYARNNTNPEAIQQALQSVPDGDKIWQQMQDYNATANTLAPYVPQEKMATVAGLTLKVKNLDNDALAAEGQKATLPEAVHGPIDAQIQSINDQKNNLSQRITQALNENGSGEQVEQDNVLGGSVVSKNKEVSVIMPNGKDAASNGDEIPQTEPKRSGVTVIQPQKETELPNNKITDNVKEEKPQEAAPEQQETSRVQPEESNNDGEKSTNGNITDDDPFSVFREKGESADEEASGTANKVVEPFDEKPFKERIKKINADKDRTAEEKKTSIARVEVERDNAKAEREKRFGNGQETILPSQDNTIGDGRQAAENNGETEDATTQQQTTIGDNRQSGNDNGAKDKGTQGSDGKPTKILKKRAKPTIKSPLYKKALDIESEDPRTQVLQYFIRGGKIHTDAIKKFFNGDNGEINAHIGVRGKDAPKTIDALTHKLWDNSSEETQNLYDTQDFRNAVEDVLLKHNHPSTMAKELVDENDKVLNPDEDAYENYLRQKYGENPKEAEEYIDNGIDILEGLSDAEIQKFVDDEKTGNSSQEHINKLIDQHEAENSEEDETPFHHEDTHSDDVKKMQGVIKKLADRDITKLDDIKAMARKSLSNEPGFKNKPEKIDNLVEDAFNANGKEKENAPQEVTHSVIGAVSKWANKLFGGKKVTVLSNTKSLLAKVKELQGEKNFHQEKSEEKFGNSPLKDVYLSISKNGLTKENLQKIGQYAKDIIEGKARYKRFNAKEQEGLKRGGQHLTEATLIAGRSEEVARQGVENNQGTQTKDLTNDQLAERQEKDVRNYAVKNKIWHTNTEKYLENKYGEPLSREGKESIVWYDPKRGVVIKSFDTYHQFPTLEKALDAITLHNTDFPETALKVIGFGKNEDGNFSLITEQPYIKPAEDGGVPTMQELKDFAKSNGYIPHDRGIDNSYQNNETYLHDLHEGNVIKDKDDKLHAIDTTMSIKKGAERGDNEIEYPKEDSATPGIQFHYNKDGKILGFTHDGKIYLNGEHLNPNTPIHEAGHLWIEWAKDNATHLYTKGLELVNGTRYLKKVMESDFYQKEALKQGEEGSAAYNAYMKNEAIAMAIGDKGAQFVTEAKQSFFKKWIDRLWSSVRRAAGLKDITNEEMQNLTFNDFAHRAAADILKEGAGEETSKQNTEQSTTQEEKEKTDGGKIEGKVVGVSHERLNNLANELGLPEIKRGHTLSPEEYAERGRKILKSGVDVNDYINSNADLHDKISVARAHLEDLERTADKIQDKTSQQYKDAQKKADDFSRDTVKKLGTDAAHAFTALQGERDLQTDSFTALSRAYKDAVGRDLTDKETKDLQGITDNIAKTKEEQKSNSDKIIDNLTDEHGKDGAEMTIEKKKTARESRQKERVKKVDKFFDDAIAKVSDKGVMYSTIIPPEVFKLALKGMKEAYHAGEDIYTVVSNAIDAISEKVGDKWNKDKFKDEYVTALESMTRSATPEEKNIQRLEKELDALKRGEVKEKGIKREPSVKERDLTDQIRQEKEKLGILPTKLTDKDSLLDTVRDIKENAAKGGKMQPNHAKAIWEYINKNHFSKDEDYASSVSDTAKELGLTIRQIEDAIVTPKTKPLTDEAWMNRSRLTRQRNAAKRYVEESNENPLLTAYKKTSSLVRTIAVEGHFSVFLGTHGMGAVLDPRHTTKAIHAYFDTWKLALSSDAKYEMAKQDLRNDPNYNTALRYGLQSDVDVRTNNDPDAEISRTIEANEDKSKNKIIKGLKHFHNAGNRAYLALKILRMDIFNAKYDAMTEAEKQDPETLKRAAESANNMTNASKVKIPKAINEITFAPQMEASRWKTLLINPVKTITIPLDRLMKGEKLSSSDKWFIKETAIHTGAMVGTFLASRAILLAVQNQFYPDKKVDLSDWHNWIGTDLQFGKLHFNATSGLGSTAKFIYSTLPTMLAGKEKTWDGEQWWEHKFPDYARRKLAPFYSLIADVYTGKDINGNELPINVRGDEHLKPAPWGHVMNWKEFLLKQTPIPVSEAFAHYYEAANKQGASDHDVNAVTQAMMLGMLSATTGISAYEKDDKVKNEGSRSEHHRSRSSRRIGHRSARRED